jgi:hypothetical protein
MMDTKAHYQAMAMAAHMPLLKADKRGIPYTHYRGIVVDYEKCRGHLKDLERMPYHVLNALINSGHVICPRCNDDGVIHTHEGERIGPCSCQGLWG